MRTQKWLKGLLVVAGVSLFMGTAASAASLTIDRVVGYYTGVGGEFTLSGTGYEVNYSPLATAVNRFQDLGFQSFCLEFNESLTIPGVYNYTIDSWAIAGGVGGGNPDPLSVGTSWLYSNFAQGMLLGYNYAPVVPGRAVSAGQLQEAIWWLEDEISLDAIQQALNPFLGQVVTQFGDLASGKVDAAPGQYGVRVLNLTTATGALRQSQLVWGVADGGLTLLLLGSGVLALAGVRRRITQ